MPVALRLKGSEQHHLASALWLTLNTADLPLLPLWTKISSIMSASLPILTRPRNRFHLKMSAAERFMPEG